MGQNNPPEGLNESSNAYFNMFNYINPNYSFHLVIFLACNMRFWWLLPQVTWIISILFTFHSYKSMAPEKTFMAPVKIKLKTRRILLTWCIFWGGGGASYFFSVLVEKLSRDMNELLMPNKCNKRCLNKSNCLLFKNWLMMYKNGYH